MTLTKLISDPTQELRDEHILEIIEFWEERDKCYYAYHKKKDQYEDLVNALVTWWMPKTKAEAKVQQENKELYADYKDLYVKKIIFERRDKRLRGIHYHAEKKNKRNSSVDASASSLWAAH